MTRTNKQRGISLIEVILAGALLALLVTSLIGSYLYGEEANALAGNQARATMLAEEGLEATRNIRDSGWAMLPPDGTYGLATTSNKWNLAGSSDTQGVFLRQITLASVDTNRKTATVTVTWQQNPSRTGSVSLATRLTNWQVAAANSSPTAVNDSITIHQFTSNSLTFDPRTNDFDTDGDTLTITGVTQPSHGTVTFTSTNVTYTVATFYFGSDSFAYTISDGHGNNATATVSVTDTF